MENNEEKNERAEQTGSYEQDKSGDDNRWSWKKEWDQMDIGHSNWVEHSSD